MYSTFNKKYHVLMGEFWIYNVGAAMVSHYKSTLVRVVLFTWVFSSSAS